MREIDPLILESRRRCEELGLDPTSLPYFSTKASKSELYTLHKNYKEILSVIDFSVHRLLEFVKDVPVLIVITDERGCILQMAGDETIKNIVLESGIRVGLVFSEEEAGTNSITLALNHRQSIQIVGSEHYFHFLRSSVCYSVPFSGPESECILGTVTIMTGIEQHNPFLLAMLSAVVDSIERELLLKRQNTRLHLMNQIVIEGTRNGIIITDKDGTITETNTLAETWLDARKNTFFEKSIKDEQFIHCIRDVLYFGKEHRNIEVQIHQSKDFICSLDAYPVYDEQGHVSGSVVQFRDVTESYKTQRQIDYLAYHDDLTGLYNRRHFVKTVSQLVADGHHQTFAIMLLDIDRFKRINDNLGHHHGDELLKLVANRLSLFIRSTDLLARMGGDEFIILLNNVNSYEYVVSVAEEVINAFKNPFIIDNYDFHMTVSIGISMYPKDGSSLEQLMRHADIAMYQAKEFGKDQYMFFQPDKNNDRMDQIVLENSLQKALKNEEFTIEYQPQIDSLTNQVVGLEALIRWRHPTHGIIYPGAFIPLAEETGIIEPLGEWVLRNSCRQMADWISKGLSPIKVSVNLSLRQFKRPTLVSTIKSILDETNLDPKYLELEITETMTMDVTYTVEILKQLKNLGVQIAIDDFGTGYSNLFHFKMFAIDQLKIDQSFVRNVLTNKNDADIVSTIIAMARSLDIDVTAEGVETKEQMSFLQSKGCYRVQGYLYSKPLPAEQTELALQNPQLYLTGGQIRA